MGRASRVEVRKFRERALRDHAPAKDKRSGPHVKILAVNPWAPHICPLGYDKIDAMTIVHNAVVER